LLIFTVCLCSSGGKIIQIGTYGAAFHDVENLSIDLRSRSVLHRLGSQTSTIVFINVRGTRCRAILVHVAGTVWNAIAHFHSVHSQYAHLAQALGHLQLSRFGVSAQPGSLHSMVSRFSLLRLPIVGVHRLMQTFALSPCNHQSTILSH